MPAFIYEALAGRVVFGFGGLAQIAAEVERLNCQRAWLIVTASAEAYVTEVSAVLGNRLVGTERNVVQHVPTEVAQRACQTASAAQADCLITLGGGSAIGLGKAVAVETGWPIIAIPTTFSGSEMTPIYGLTSAGRKNTARDTRALPRTVIYDPALVYSMPPNLAAASGVNAMAHCVEALYAQNANPIVSLMAEEGLRALATALPNIIEGHRDAAYEQALYGAYLGGAALGAVGTALHHRTCHVLGGSYNLGHSAVHSVILPYAVMANSDYALGAMERIASILDSNSAAAGLFELNQQLGLASSLAQIGMQKADLDEAARLICDTKSYNPRPYQYDWVRQMLEAAYYGHSAS